MPIPLSRQIQNSISVEPGVVPVEIRDSWRVTLVSDETLNDSDKSIPVPASAEWQVLWLWVEFASTATVGDRQIVIEIQDSAADVIAQIRAGITQAASLTRYYMFGPSMADMFVVRDGDWIMTPLPPTLILQTGDIIRIYDNNAVDAAADDMVIQMQIAARTV